MLREESSKKAVVVTRGRQTPKPLSKRPVKVKETPVVMDQELRAMVAETAYFLAEERGFVGDGAFGDWLKAEELVQRRLRQSPGTKLGHPASRKK